MKCSINGVVIWISLAMALLATASALAYAWQAALPLFAAAAIVASVVGLVVPKIKQALLDYAACRGASVKCSIDKSINALGQVPMVLSAATLVLAGIIQTGALAAIATVVFAWIGIAAQAAVAILVAGAIVGCGAAILILAGCLTNAFSYKSCMDAQDPNVGGAGPLEPR